MLSRITVPIALALALAACGGSDGGDPAGPSQQGATVNATPQLAFTPATVTIPAGRSVTFRFGSVAHNVFFDAAAGVPADIPTATANASVTRTFNTAGTYRYSCHLHAGMSGTVVVQ